MKRANCFLLAITLTFAACGGSGGGGGKSAQTVDNNAFEPADNSQPTPSTGNGRVPAAALSFDTNIYFLNVNDIQAAKFDRAIEILKLVVATEEFRTRVLNYTYQGVKRFVDNNDLSNSEIYQTILNGAEKLRPDKNNTMDIEVELYTANTNVVGYTYPNVSKIWVNTKYFNSYTAAGVAHNLMHEWLHKLGFGHDSAATASRPYSVPYAIGSIVADIGKDFL